MTDASIAYAKNGFKIVSDFSRATEKRMFPYRKPTAYITLPCATALACDHSTIVAQVDLRVPQNHTTEYRAQRYWRQFDLERFIEHPEQSSLVRDSTDNDNVHELFGRYDNTLHSLLDVHAPTRAARSAP